MARIVIPENGHVVNIVAPVDIDGGLASDIFSMKDASHVDILIQLGVTGASSTITVEECDDFTPSNSTAIPFAYYAEETAGGDTLGERVNASASGFATSANDGIFYVISIDAEELSEGFANLRIVASDPGSATFLSASAIITGLCYQEKTTRTQIV